MSHKPDALRNEVTELKVRAPAEAEFTYDLLFLSFSLQSMTFFTYALISFYQNFMFGVIFCTQIITRRLF